MRTYAPQLLYGLDRPDAAAGNAEQSNRLIGKCRRETQVFNDQLYHCAKGAVVLRRGEYYPIRTFDLTAQLYGILCIGMPGKGKVEGPGINDDHFDIIFAQLVIDDG